MSKVISIRDSKRQIGKDEESSITRETVDSLISTNSYTKFGELQKSVSDQLGRVINFSERRIISDSLRAAFCAAAEKKREEDDNSHRGILIFTAYSDDYLIGKLCDSINREYAAKHKYNYLSESLSYGDMMKAIGPRKDHCTWYKVLMLKRLLIDEAENLARDKIQYLLWIDADAVVINDNVRIEDLIERGKGRDLIIAENMHSGCLVNAGVMLVRVSEWSKLLWQEVWDSKKHDTVTFYEQSALLQRLRAKREGLEMTGDGDGGDTPFHSYLPGGPKGVKLYAHVAVLPHLELNTNSGWVCEGRQIERSRSRRTQKSRQRLNKMDKIAASALVDEGADGIQQIQDLTQDVSMMAAEGVGDEEEGGRVGRGGGDEESTASAVENIEIEGTAQRPLLTDDRAVYERYLSGLEMPHFIFHAAGHCGKLESLKGVLLKSSIKVSEEFLALERFCIPKGKDKRGRDRVGDGPTSVMCSELNEDLELCPV